MRYRHVLAAFYSTPLAILPAKLAEIRDFLNFKASGGDVAPVEIGFLLRRRSEGASAEAAEIQARAGDGVQRAGRVGIVPVMGTISQRGGNMDDISTQMVSCEEIGAQLDTLAADKTCKAICMLFDSPGGSVYGVGELANKIRAVAQEKKCVAMVDSVCASAAYWLASQCGEINVTPGGQVGSIGVLAAHEDHSAEADQAGVKTTLVTSSKYKAEGNPWGPMDDEAKAELQSKVDAYHAMFVAAVARGRGVTEHQVNTSFGQGRMAMAADAVKAGMADRVATFAQVLNRLGAGGEVGLGGFPAKSCRMAVALAAGRIAEAEGPL